MKGKDKGITNKEINQPISPATVEKNESLAAPASANVKNGKGNKDDKKRSNIFVRAGKRIGRACKESYSELKKVTWAPFGKVVASTGVVLAVVCIFLAILLGVDTLLSFILDLIIKM